MAGVSSLYPIGHYLKTIGDIGDRETETQVVLLEHEIQLHRSQKCYGLFAAKIGW